MDAIGEVEFEASDDSPVDQGDDPFIQNYRKIPLDQRDEYVKNYNEAQAFCRSSWTGSG